MQLFSICQNQTNYCILCGSKLVFIAIVECHSWMVKMPKCQMDFTAWNRIKLSQLTTARYSERNTSLLKSAVSVGVSFFFKVWVGPRVVRFRNGNVTCLRFGQLMDLRLSLIAAVLVAITINRGVWYSGGLNAFLGKFGPQNWMARLIFYNRNESRIWKYRHMYIFSFLLGAENGSLKNWKLGLPRWMGNANGECDGCI